MLGGRRTPRPLGGFRQWPKPLLLRVSPSCHSGGPIVFSGTDAKLKGLYSQLTMNMPVIVPSGLEHQHDQWIVNGDPVFGVVPSGLIPACPRETPIHLYRGTLDWGWHHICHKHGEQRLFTFTDDVEQMIWTKCSERGNIHSSKDPQGLTISITVAPTAFMVLKYLPRIRCFSITTMYSLRKPNTEPVIGQYVGSARPQGRPVYAWLPYL